jgi:hypothetical protein
MPSFLLRMLQIREVNCAPLSEVITAGTPNLVAQAAMSVSEQVAAAMSRTGAAHRATIDSPFRLVLIFF